MAPLLAELPVPQSDPEQVRRIVEQVLSGPEYHWEVTLRDRVWAWFGELFLRVVDAIAGAGQGSPLGSIVLLAVAAVVLWLTLRFVRKVRRDPAVRPELEGPVGRAADQWRAEAEEHEARGRWREAVRCRYRALIAELSADGIIEERPGRTAGEYAAEVRERAPGAAQAFAGATSTFEAAWYGDEPVGREDAARLVEQSSQSLAAARARRTSSRPLAGVR